MPPPTRSRRVLYTHLSTQYPDYSPRNDMPHNGFMLNRLVLAVVGIRKLLRNVGARGWLGEGLRLVPEAAHPAHVCHTVHRHPRWAHHHVALIPHLAGTPESESALALQVRARSLVGHLRPPL